jgi:hypothetical protein
MKKWGIRASEGIGTPLLRYSLHLDQCRMNV